MVTTPELAIALAGVIATVTAPILVMQWSNRNALKQSLDDKHAENLSKFNQLLTDRLYHPPHSHDEKEGPLYAEGIRTTPVKIDGKD